MIFKIGELYLVKKNSRWFKAGDVVKLKAISSDESVLQFRQINGPQYIDIFNFDTVHDYIGLNEEQWRNPYLL